MAPSLMRYETETTIDVSQGAQSSPINTEPKLHVEATPEIVEDSFKDIPKGGPVQPPQNEESNESDDLYSLSPQGKASHEKLKATKAIPRSVERDPGNVFSSIGEPQVAETSPDPLAQHESRTIVEPNAGDALLEQSVKGGKPAVTNERSARNRAENEGGEATDELQHAEITLSRPGRTQSISSHATHRPNMCLPNGDGRQPRTTPLVSTNQQGAAKLSALAALQAKRQIATSTPHPETSRAAGAGPKAAKNPVSFTARPRAPLQVKDKNIQTPAPSDKSARSPSAQPTTTGKLPSRKDRMLAQTPSKIVSGNASRESGLTLEDKSDVSNITVKSKVTNGKQRLQRQDARKPAKQQEGTSKISKQVKLSTYDVAESSDNDEASRASKKSRTTKAAKTKTKTKTGADTASKRKAQPSESTAAQSRRSDNAPSGALRGTRAGNGSKIADTAKESSAKAQMKVINADQADEYMAPHTSKADHATSKSAVGFGPHKPDTKRGKNLASGSLKNKLETISHDSNDINDQVHPHIDNKVHPSYEKAALHALVAQDQQDTVGGLSNPARTEGHDQSHGKIVGASQEDAIILSDRQQSSSSAPSTTGLVQETQAPTGHRKNAPRIHRPKTPAAFASSPPVANKIAQSTSATTLVGDETSRRATIISFDKNGPRNQGSLSAKKKAAGSLWKGRSSVPPIGPIPSDTSRRVKLDSMGKHVPSSAATSMKSSKSVCSAPPNNVAADVTDALSGFMKKPVQSDTLNQKDSEYAADAPKPTDSHNLDDDDFHAIDDFDGPTPVDEGTMLDKPTTSMKQVRPTASQVAMPPPAQKRAREPAKQQAPTVPQMLPSDMSGFSKRSSRTGVTDSAVVTRKRALDQQQSEQSCKRARHSTQHSSAIPPALQPDALAAATSGVSMPAPTRRIPRKPSRVASQGSQKVDIHGSPVPEGMTVPGQSTVLEIFSQQAGLSSDTAIEHIRVRNAVAVHNESGRNVAAEERGPSRRQSVQSSNSKAKPAGPFEESQAITKIVRVHTSRPLVEDETAIPPTDPFTSSDADRKRTSTGSHTSTFRAQLDCMMTDTQDQHIPPVHTNARADDPDRTLVGSERATRVPKRISDFSTLSSSEETADTDDSTASQRDLGLWRNALQPHQLNLFDELVTISHKLVRHLVDKETAIADVANDYRTRGLNIIEQMEVFHAKQCQNYIETMKARKKRLRKDLNDCGRKLNEGIATMTEGKRRRAEQLQMDDGLEDTLQGVIAGFC